MSVDLAGARDGTIGVRSASGTVVAGQVRLATSFWARFRGLMGSAPLAPDAGLFLPVNSIHMLFMRFAIDAVFVDGPDAGGDRRVVAIRGSLPAWRGLVMPVRGATGVLELCAGTAARQGLRPGDIVRFGRPSRFRQRPHRTQRDPWLSPRFRAAYRQRPPARLRVPIPGRRRARSRSRLPRLAVRGMRVWTCCEP